MHKSFLLLRVACWTYIIKLYLISPKYVEPSYFTPTSSDTLSLFCILFQPVINGQLVTQMLENSSSQYLMLSKWKWACYVLLVMVLFAYLVMHSDIEKPFSGCLAFKCWRKTYNCFWWYLGCFIFWYGCQVLSRFTCRACCKACCEGGV